VLTLALANCLRLKFFITTTKWYPINQGTTVKDLKDLIQKNEDIKYNGDHSNELENLWITFNQ